MNNFSLEEKLLLKVLCEILNSSYFRNLNGKSQIYLSSQKPFDYQEITMKDIDKLYEKSQSINNENFDANFIPKNFFELVPYFFADISYDKSEKIVINYLESNIINENSLLMTRGMHTLTVAACSALTAKRVHLDRYSRILTIVCALSHDIFHYPYAHTMEKVVEDMVRELGFDRKNFSHEQMGAIIIEKLYEEFKDNIIASESSYPKEFVDKKLNEVVKSIKDGILSHSMQRCKSTPIEIVHQIVRDMDKMYSFHDLLDLMKQVTIIGKKVKKSPAVTKNQIRNFITNSQTINDIKKHLEREMEKGNIQTININQMDEEIRLTAEEMLDIFEKSPVKAMMYCIRKTKLEIKNGKVRMDEVVWQLLLKFKEITSSLRKMNFIKKDEESLEIAIKSMIEVGLQEKNITITTEKEFQDFLIEEFGGDTDRTLLYRFCEQFVKRRLQAEMKAIKRGEKELPPDRKLSNCIPKDIWNVVRSIAAGFAPLELADK